MSLVANIVLATKVKTHAEEAYLEHFSRMLNLLVVDMCAKYPDKERNLSFACELDSYQLLDNEYIQLIYTKRTIDNETLRQVGEPTTEEHWIWPHGEPDDPALQSHLMTEEELEELRKAQ